MGGIRKIMVLWQAVFLAASPLVTAPPSYLTRLYYNGSAAKSHSTTTQYRQLRRLVTYGNIRMPFSFFKTNLKSNNVEKCNFKKPCKEVFIKNFNNISKCNLSESFHLAQGSPNIFFPYIRMSFVCNKRVNTEIRIHTSIIIIHCTNYLSSHWLKAYSFLGNHRNLQIN